MRHCFRGVGLLALFIGLPFVGLMCDGALAASAEKGKIAFMKYGCWQCHGTQGQGSVVTSGGKVLAPDPLPWEGFSAFVRGTNRGMPPYSEKVLPNDDLADIHAYLLSIPKAKDVKSIPLLSQ
ncbi:MAG TPA: cytochrome c [Xanthobacteraceae bacterium]|nr:cytochrome c [Xanthobacteraceae bacterium]